MSLVFAFIVSTYAAAIGVVSLLRKPVSVASCCFALGMLALGIESILNGFMLNSVSNREAKSLSIAVIMVRSTFPGLWLAFSLSYSRGNSKGFLSQWRIPLIGAALLPFAVAAYLYFQEFHLQEFEITPLENGNWWFAHTMPVKAFNLISLFFTIFILVNFEKTFRTAVGTQRWRIKFLLLGVAFIFGTRIYTISQTLLYAGSLSTLVTVEFGALLIGCLFITFGYHREGFNRLNLYPSREVLQGSFTVILAATYLVVIGVLAQLAAKVVGGQTFQAQALVILIGLSGLASVLVSSRFELTFRNFVSRHFRRPQHDSRRIWSQFTQRISGVLDRPTLCREFTKLISETFDVFSVSLLIRDGDGSKFTVAASTNEVMHQTTEIHLPDLSSAGEDRPFDIEDRTEEWAKILCASLPNLFGEGSNRMAVPLTSGEHFVGLAILGDRVNAMIYREEELELLQCIGGHIATTLLNRDLSQKLTQTAQFEAFQTMSTFFAHDLKNAANHLNLMLGNLPRHFKNPEFREDALRSIAGSVGRINHLIGKLNEFRSAFQIETSECDLNDLLTRTVAEFEKDGSVKVCCELKPLPSIPVDEEKMQSAITNLLINAREATDDKHQGLIYLRTGIENGYVLLVVEDNGCGMDPDFVKHSLFRPFCSTKTKGIGIGMYQIKMIVEAHRGRIEVESESKQGTKFRILLPIDLKD